MNDLGFVWDIEVYYWEKNFEALVAYKAEFGDCLVPQKFIYQGLKLGIWVGTQRSKKETLSPERIQRLNDLGFVWDPLTQQWEESFKALVAYKADLEIVVPDRYQYLGVSLGPLGLKQRSKKKTSLLKGSNG